MARNRGAPKDRTRATVRKTSVHNPACSKRSHDSAELRCGCGCLLARFLADEIELKCRRCKRMVIVSVVHDNNGRAFKTKLGSCLCAAAEGDQPA